tara:strand:+ start:515 stop:1063 length:549 start_codon:yes stop_codon:yes gene_type:complete
VCGPPEFVCVNLAGNPQKVVDNVPKLSYNIFSNEGVPMRFQVKLKAKTVWTARKRALLRDALQYANVTLGLDNVDMTVVVKLSGDAYAPGMCCNFGNDVLLVKVSGNQTEEEIVETLFHELTHVRQYALGQLEDVGEQVVYWLGHYYRGDFENTDSLEYWNAPWEVEARQVGWKLLNDYYQS